LAPSIKVCNVYKQCICVYKQIFSPQIMSDVSSLPSDGEIDIQPLITKLGRPDLLQIP
jgi:hypothetical protein